MSHPQGSGERCLSRFLGRGCDKALFNDKGGGNSVNQGFGKDFYRKGNSVKRFPPDSEN